MITAKEIMQREGINNSCLLYNKTWKYYACNEGNGKFNRKKYEELVKIEEAREWFTKQVQLFVEYLNKIEKIRYNVIAAKAKVASGGIYNVNFGYKIAVKILVAFRKYARGFDEFYEA